MDARYAGSHDDFVGVNLSTYIAQTRITVNMVRKGATVEKIGKKYTVRRFGLLLVFWELMCQRYSDSCTRVRLPTHSNSALGESRPHASEAQSFVRFCSLEGIDITIGVRVECRLSVGSRCPHVCGKRPKEISFAVPMWSRGNTTNPE